MERKVSLIAGILFISSILFANAQITNEGRYVFVISKVNYLKAIEDAVVQSGSQGIELQEARVILCGESVKAFAEDSPIVKKALRNPKIKLYACGLSLEQMNIDPKVLPAQVQTVRNGILEGMKLENEGYRRVDL